MTLIPTTNDLQNITRPLLQNIFASLGKDVHVVRTQTSAPTTGNGDEWGKSETVTTENVTGPYRCYIYQLSLEARSKFDSLGGNISIPDWELIADIAVPLGQPGYKIRYLGRDFIPTGPAEDMGNQQIGWRLLLTDPQGRGAL